MVLYSNILILDSITFTVDPGVGGSEDHIQTFEYLHIFKYSYICMWLSDPPLPVSLTLYDTDAGKPKLTYPKVKAEGG